MFVCMVTGLVMVRSVMHFRDKGKLCPCMNLSPFLIVFYYMWYTRIKIHCPAFYMKMAGSPSICLKATLSVVSWLG